MRQAPFQVMCFKGGINASGEDVKSPLVVGAEYTVIDQDVKYMCGKVRKLFSLAEVSEYWFDARLFATLPSESEEVGIEQEQEAIIYQR